MALGAMQTIGAAGVAQTYATPGSTENVTPFSGMFLHVKNANGSPCVVTITDAGSTPAGNAATNPTVSVPATTGDKMIYLSPSLASPTTGLIGLAFSVTSSVSVALLRVG